MGPLNVHLTTFNCGRALIDVPAFSSALAQSFKSTVLPPDLIVLSLQEIAPLGPSFLANSLVTPYLTRYEAAVHRATSKRFNLDASDGYETIAFEHAGMTALAILVKREIVSKIEVVEHAYTGCGFCDMGNKGAVGVRLKIETETSGDRDALVTFVAAHLAPMEDHWKRRNEDWKTICETLVFVPPSQSDSDDPVTSHSAEGEEAEPLLADSRKPARKRLHGMFYPPSTIFFAGDLNYRTSDTAPSPDEHKSWPQPPIASSDGSAFSELLQHDQLTRERKAQRTLHHLSESPITFPPTYKHSSAAQRLAAKGPSLSDTPPSQQSSPLWSTHRFPSWCDRILYSTPSGHAPEVHAYMALPVQPTSDHRPVTLACTLSPEVWAVGSSSAGGGPPKAPFPLAADWRDRRDAARRLELVVGAGAWLGWTGQGRMVLGSVVLGLVALGLLLTYA